MNQTNNIRPKDWAARQKALDITQSFAVSAPAGSGKTGLLTQRFLKLLCLCQHPEEVLAITFTRKAAGEMQERILKALWKAQSISQQDIETLSEHDQLTHQIATQLLKHNDEKKWHLLESPQRLRIQTIDSLCSRISQQLPLANGFGSSFAMSDNPQKLYQMAVRQLFNELESLDNEATADDLKTLLQHFDNNFQTLETLLIELLASRDQWLGFVFASRSDQARDYLESVLEKIIRAHLSDVKNNLTIFSSELLSVVDWAVTNIEKTDPQSALLKLKNANALPIADSAHIEHWQALVKFLQTEKGEFRKRLTVNEGFPNKKDHPESDAFKNKMLEWFEQVRLYNSDIESQLAEIINLPYATYQESQWQLLEALTRLLPRLAAFLDLVFAAQGEADFIAVSQAALKALGDEDSPTELALQLDYQIKHLLVDEFQDTSLPQLQLLEKLIAGWQASDGRTLFIVGDAMQSCYGFRDAKVGIFLKARQEGIGQLPLEAVNLTVNFRSQGGIVHWANHHFSHAYPTHDNINRGAVKYFNSDPFKETLTQPAVTLDITRFQKLKKNDQENIFSNRTEEQNYIAELKEAELVANNIQRARAEYPQDSIALLARSRKHLQLLFPELKKRKLEWRATDIDSLADKMSIIDLASLTKALLNLDDRIAWLSILRAPWCGLSLDDLHSIAHEETVLDLTATSDYLPIYSVIAHYENLASLSENGKKSLSRFVPIIQMALNEIYRKNLRQWIEGIWLSLGGPACLSSTEELSDTETFFKLLDSFERGGGIEDWPGFQRALENLYATPNTQAANAIQVMTLHKSKGLEFDHVFIPCLHKPSVGDKNKLLLWREIISNTHGAQLLISPMAPTGSSSDTLYQYIKNEIKWQQTFEATRLFYVGCTRAIKHLYLSASLEQNENGEYKEPPKGSLISSIWQTAQTEITSVFNAAENTNKNLSISNLSMSNPSAENNLMRLSNQWINPLSASRTTISIQSPLKDFRGHEYNDDENIPELESTENRFDKTIGIIVHAAFEHLSQHELPKNIDTWLNERKTFWNMELTHAGFNGELLEKAVQKINRALRNALEDVKGQWILNCAHLDSASELSIISTQTTATELKLRENIIDRTFIDNGTRWIIDYKTSEPKSPETIDEFIQSEKLQYAEQLLRYKKCFADGAIKTALYFPLVPVEHRFIELE